MRHSPVYQMSAWPNSVPSKPNPFKPNEANASESGCAMLVLSIVAFQADRQAEQERQREQRQADHERNAVVARPTSWLPAYATKDVRSSSGLTLTKLPCFPLRDHSNEHSHNAEHFRDVCVVREAIIEQRRQFHSVLLGDVPNLVAAFDPYLHAPRSATASDPCASGGDKNACTTGIGLRPAVVLSDVA